MIYWLRLMELFIGYLKGLLVFLPLATVFLVASDRNPFDLIGLEKGGLDSSKDIQKTPG